MTEPLVSVIMITYNHEKFIKEAIEGVLNQETDFKFELIIANDCSPDNTAEIIENILNSHPKAEIIKFINNETNFGANRNYLNAYNKSKGKYIAVCEGDDFWVDELKLQKQIDFLENNSEYVLTYHDAQCIDVNGNLIQNVANCTPQKEFSASELKKGKQPLPLTTCYRKVITELPKNMIEIINGDTYLTSLLGNYGKGKWLNIKPAFYRHHAGGVWSLKNQRDKLKSKIELFTVLHLHYKNKKDQDSTDYYKREKNNTIKMLIYQSFETGDIHSGFNWILIFLKNFRF